MFKSNAYALLFGLWLLFLEGGGAAEEHKVSTVWNINGWSFLPNC